MHGFYKNWQIYQHDIVFMGGSVTYYGENLVRDGRSYVRDALVSLNGASCNCRMECFRDGSAVIIGFVKDGECYRNSLFKEAEELLHSYDACKLLLPEERLLKLHLRTVLQFITLVLQFASVYFLIKHVVLLFIESFICINLFKAALFALFIIILGQMYSCYRKL